MKTTQLLAVAAATSLAVAQTCNVLSYTFPAPVMASGYRSQLVATGLGTPRAIVFDTAGYLLVARRGTGIVRFQVGSCGTLQNQQTIISDSTLNHGLTISADGRTVFASSSTTAFSWSYDPATGATSNKKTLVTGMSNGPSGHTTRTLYASLRNPDLLLVSWGSDGNLDWSASNINSGRSQIRGFSISQTSNSPIAFNSGGTIFGWGLRNSVGIGEDLGGGIWSVENSADNIVRNGQDVHNENPAEELNYHGLATDSTNRGNYGYPECLTAWQMSGITTGVQFSNGSSSVTDAQCAQRQAPRISFNSHTAPLDVKFDPQGNAWVSFHGSWNRSPPDGYRVSMIPFSGNQPIAASNSMAAAVNIMTNPNNGACPGQCFRPVGLAFDRNGRLFVSSDSTGEIYMIEKIGGTTLTTTTTTTSRTTTTSSRTTTTTSRTTTTTFRTTTTTSRTTTPSTTASRTTTAGPAQPTWAQCGGIGWTGSTSCVGGTSCRVLNPYYSQCIPG
ncbi:hypothetical protein Dda_8821 [Drechslerella dactyloides]|uniref:CBM1 domain-containing protein n=1 Tax=Drechslerella dactyloides TaxID=74499 RepID=A0AAD6IQ06_DREDA|nr:hypothetical protein Dda_8821 [Drechslerella dactyloides]